MLKQLEAWHGTTVGLVFFVLAELLATYLVISLAIDRGNLLWYIAAVALFIGTIVNLVRLARKFFKKDDRA